ncbi:MAG: hypothetical protein E7283_01175 [Lachnospiraceae bacterium]|nr:hypothetical protein [Lachnospiraceae bacterium]
MGMFLKKYRIYSVLLICLCMVCSCSNENVKDNPKFNWTESTETGVTIDIGKIVQEQIDLDNYSLEYNEQTDMPSFFLWNTLALSENGCYFWQNMNLKFYDFQSKKSVYVCGKPECTHGFNSECDSYFKEDNIWFQANMLQYYDGYIYMIGSVRENSVEKIILYKVSTDGRTREPYMELFRTEQNIVVGENGQTALVGQPVSACIHQGYIYYNVINETPLKIRRMKLGDTQSETIYTVSGERGALYRLKAYGDYLLFQSGNFVDDKQIDIQAGIFAYNIRTGEVTFIKKNAVNSYCIYDKTLYYSSPGEIRTFSLETQEDRLLIRHGAGYLSCYADEKYVYTFGSKTLDVYNHEGNKICSVVDKNISLCMYGASGMLFAETRGTGKDNLAVIYTDDFADGSARWSYIGEYGVD